MAEHGERVGGFAACALLACAALASAQKSKPVEPPPAVDPYTRGEPEALARAGYRTLGEQRFGPATSATIQQQLGDVPMLWVETEHFRLGSCLAEYKPTQPEEIEELKLELAELGKTIERVPAKPKKLDPWLRLHLFARRLERLHAELVLRLGLDTSGDRRGRKPALAMREKFLVLLTQKKSTLARFTREYCGVENGESYLYTFSDLGALFFGVSDEAVALGDAELHYSTVYGVTQNLLYGINGFPHLLPTWWTNGLALWFARATQPRVLLYAKPANEILPPAELADWQPLVRGRAESGACLPWADMLARANWLEQPFGDSVVLWSRIDYLLAREGTAQALTTRLSLPVPQPPDSRVALQDATGLELDALDEAWRAWVRETYRKKRK
ncbi:MAG: hypothetical protein EXS08_13165 [Planctomycetes bacterium]|nr:hypothetical protein [Planctomycetota bacterium]